MVKPTQWALWGWMGFLPALVQAQPVSLAVDAGRCRCVLPANQTYHLVLGSLANHGQVSPVRLRLEKIAQAPSLPPAVELADFYLPALVETTERMRKFRRPPEKFPPRSPPEEKHFFLFQPGRDLHNPRHYSAVAARRLEVGRDIVVYADQDDLALPHLAKTAGEIVRFFDEELFSWSRRHLGAVEDLDRDGRFTVFLSRQLKRLAGAGDPLDGFVRGSDFLRDLSPPFSHRCDMLYLNAELEAGPHLRSILAHEFTHAIVVCERLLLNPAGERREEECWLNEGLAYLVEYLQGHSFQNLEARVGAFLQAPEKSPLVIPDYHRAGLWRAPGPRGAAFLFLRWCASRQGPDFSRRLAQSPWTGLKNLEAAAGQPFSRLFRDWTVALAQETRFRPHPEILTPGLHSKNLEGTTCGFFVIPADSARILEIEAPAAALLQVTLVPVEQEAPAMGDR